MEGGGRGNQDGPPATGITGVYLHAMHVHNTHAQSIVVAKELPGEMLNVENWNAS